MSKGEGGKRFRLPQKAACDTLKARRKEREGVG